mgnify:CR=1 FL=1
MPSPEELRAREWRRPRLLDLASMLRSAWDWRSGAAGWSSSKRGKSCGTGNTATDCSSMR